MISLLHLGNTITPLRFTSCHPGINNNSTVDTAGSMKEQGVGTIPMDCTKKQIFPADVHDKRYAIQNPAIVIEPDSHRIHAAKISSLEFNRRAIEDFATAPGRKECP
jgi:hypothetical protein